MGQIRLFSARACPFAHRTRLVLTHKQTPFELVEIDLKNKPAWFDAKLSGYGKVPALEHGEVRLWESAIVNEYLDEVFPTPALLPKDPGARAIARIWIDFANTRFAPAWTKLLHARTTPDAEQATSELAKTLSVLERSGFAAYGGEGPYFFGAEPSLVDFALYPWFERWPGLAHYRGFPVPAELTRLQRYREAFAQLPAAREHANSAEFYIQRYAAVAAPQRAVA